jgi:hypothetical protein
MYYLVLYRASSSASLVCFLRLLLLGGKYPLYSPAIYKDLSDLLDIHFESFADAVNKGEAVEGIEGQQTSTATVM